MQAWSVGTTGIRFADALQSYEKQQMRLGACVVLFVTRGSVDYNCLMKTQILATKLYIPKPPGLVMRPRLIERLNGGLHGKLTLVSAPAGFGKTTLITEWIRANGLQVIPQTLKEMFR